MLFKLSVIALATKATCLFIVHLSYYLESSWPVDTDSYFYLIQFKSLAETGNLHYPHGELFFRFWQPVTSFGVDALGVSRTATLGSFLGLTLVLLLLWSRVHAASLRIVGIIVVISSYPLFTFANLFPRQTFALLFAAAGLALLKQSDQRRFILTALLLLLATLIHKSAAVLLVIFLLAQPFLPSLLSLVVVVAGLATIYVSSSKLLFEFSLKAPWFSHFQTLALSDLVGYISYYVITVCVLISTLRRMIVARISWAALAQQEKVGTLILFTCLLFLLPIWNIESYLAHRLMATTVPLVLIGLPLLHIHRSPSFWLSIGLMLSILPSTPAEVRARQPYTGPSNAAFISSRDAVQKIIPESGFVAAPHGIQYRAQYFWQRRSYQLPGEGIAGERFSVLKAEECPPTRSACIRLDNGWILLRD